MVQIATKKARGRPAKTWDDKDIDMFKRMCSRFGTRDGIAAIFGVSPKTLNRLINENLHDEIAPDSDEPITFEDAYAVYSQAGAQLLREAQFEKALSGNSTMLVWLGKQYLGQSDSKEVIVQAAEEEATALDDITARLLDIRTPPED